jgi:hypothetical protein
MGLRRLFVCLIAAAFVFNGAAMRAWANYPAAAPALGQEHHASSMAGDHAGHAGDHSGHAGHAVPESDERPLPIHSNDCLKYCNMCNAAGMTPDLGVADAILSYADAVFRLLQGDLTGQLVAVDPHIPKAIV